MNKYQKKLHKDIKSYMDCYELESYSLAKYILKNITNITDICVKCKYLNCKETKNKQLWCKNYTDR